MENIKNHKDIKLVAFDKRNKLLSESNNHTTKHFVKKSFAMEISKINIKMNKLVYLGLSILDISKRTTYEYWYDCVKQKLWKEG